MRRMNWIPIGPRRDASAALFRGLFLPSLLLAFALLLPDSARGEGRECSLRIRVSGVKNGHGKIRVAVFDQESSRFPDDSFALRRIETPAIQGTTELERSFPCGGIAVAVFHDENGNGLHDKNMLGIPVEGYGFSNNPDSQYGPPPFSKAAFQLTETGRTIEIRLLYLMD